MTATAVPKSPREVAKDVTDTIIGEEKFRCELGSGSAFGYFLGLFGSRELIGSIAEGGGGGRGSVEIGLIGAVTSPVTGSSALVAAFSDGIWDTGSGFSGIGMIGFEGLGAVMGPVACLSAFVATRRR